MYSRNKKNFRYTVLTSISSRYSNINIKINNNILIKRLESLNYIIALKFSIS